MRIVLDTNVVVAAMRSPAGASAELLRLGRVGDIDVLASATLCLEYEAVCQREEHRKAAGLSKRDVGVFLDAVIGIVTPVDVWFSWRPQLADDADDEMVLDAAVNGRADVLATFNLRHFTDARRRFGVAVLTPGDTLRRLP